MHLNGLGGHFGRDKTFGLVNEKYPQGNYKKLQPKKIGPCKILKKIIENPYLIELSEDLDISPVFNAADLHSHSAGTNDDWMNEQNEKENSNWTKHLPKKKREQVE